MPRRPDKIQITDTSHLRMKRRDWRVQRFNTPVRQELKAQAYRENVAPTILVQQCLRDVMQASRMYADLYRPWPEEELDTNVTVYHMPVMLRRKFTRFCHKKGVKSYMGLLNAVHGWLMYHGCCAFDFDESEYEVDEMVPAIDNSVKGKGKKLKERGQ